MKNELQPNGQGRELPGNSNGLTPETLNQRLRRIYWRIDSPIIYGLNALVANSVVTYMVLAPKMEPVELKPAVVVAVALIDVLAALSIRKDISDIITETRRITAMAVGRGYDARGRLFKQIRQAPTV